MEFRISGLPVLYILPVPEDSFSICWICLINERDRCACFANSKYGVDVDLIVSKVANN